MSVNPIEQALLECVESSTLNQTSQWIYEQGPELITNLVRYLDKKLPRSSYLGKTEDHVSKFLEDLIRRDSIGKRKQRGKKTYISQVKAWCLKNSHTQNRDAGTDALSRCMHGALTRREWLRPEVDQGSWSTQVVPKTLLRTEEFLGTYYDSESDIKTDGTEFLISHENPEVIIGGMRDMENLFKEIRDTFENNMTPEESDFHISLIQAFFVDKLHVAEISSIHNIPKSEVTNALMRIRRILKKARAKGVFSEFGIQA